MDSNDQPGDVPAGPTRIDRRGALRKAAAAGAVAWTAPVVLSAQAQASDGTFTPKCEPINVNLRARVARGCSDD